MLRLFEATNALPVQRLYSDTWGIPRPALIVFSWMARGALRSRGLRAVRCARHHFTRWRLDLGNRRVCWGCLVLKNFWSLFVLKLSQCRNFRADSYNSGWHLTSSVAVLGDFVNKDCRRNKTLDMRRARTVISRVGKSDWQVWQGFLIACTSGTHKLKTLHLGHLGGKTWELLAECPSQILSVIFQPLHRHKSLDVKHGFTKRVWRWTTWIKKPVPYDVWCKPPLVQLRCSRTVGFHHVSSLSLGFQHHSFDMLLKPTSWALLLKPTRHLWF